MIAVEPGPHSLRPARRRCAPLRRRNPGGVPTCRRRIDSMPYWLLFPARLIIVLIVGYPIVRVVEISFQQYG